MDANNNKCVTKKPSVSKKSKSTQTFENVNTSESIHWPLKAKIVQFFITHIYVYSIATASIFHLMFVTM